MIIIDGNNLLHRTLAREQQVTGQHSIRNLYNTLAITDQFTLWVWDGYNSRKRRQVVFPEYKNHRPEPSEDVYAMFKLFEEILSHTQIAQIKVPEWEADDVIYTLAKQMQGEKIIIDTNDADYLQIEGVELPFVSKWHWPNYLIKAYKALVGDSVDNIKGMPRFGEGSWNNMQLHHDKIDSALRDGDWEAWEKIPWGPKNKACLDRGNFDQCVMFYRIITMLDVPLDDIAKHTSLGDKQFNICENLLQRYHL